MPRSSFYYSDTHPKHDNHQEERELVQQIYHENKGRYGYRRITLEFRNRGFKTNHKVIQKLMHEEHIVCKVRQHKYNSYKVFHNYSSLSLNLLIKSYKSFRKSSATDSKNQLDGTNPLVLSVGWISLSFLLNNPFL